MPSQICLGAVIAAIFTVGAATAPSANAAPPDDACSILTQAQVSAAVELSVNAGAPTGKKTCTWTASKASANSPKFVTLLLESLNMYEGGKQAGQNRGVTVTSVDGVGDDAYYLATGSLVGLIVKKGNVAFKVAVYGDTPMEQKQAIEKSLAHQVVAKL